MENNQTSSQIKGLFILAGLLFLAFYIFFSALFQHKKIKFLHQSALAIIIGFLIGAVIFFFLPSLFERLINFSGSIVFYVLLPPMLFANGYNLKKRRFFQNIYYINIFGLIGTIINFILIALFTYLISQLGFIRDWNNINQIRNLSSWQILLFSACLCSMDPIATLSQIKPQYTPKLFSVIFGQSLVKDTVTIVLFKSILKLITVEDNNAILFQFYWYTTFSILATFIVDIICSLLIGIFFALCLTLLFKKFRFLLHNKGATQIALIFICGYISYLTTQLLGYSGVVAMLICGIFLSHFNNYNMSLSGIEASKITFQSLSLVAEGLLFVVLGIQTWQTKGNSNEGIVVHESWTFLLLSFTIIIITRFFNIIFINYLFRLCKGKDNWRLNLYELQIIFVSGLVKGAVPFALTTSILITIQSNNISVTTLIIKSSIIMIVFSTSLILNMVIPMFVRNRLKVMKQQLKESDPSLFDSLIQKQKQLQTKQQKKYRSRAQKYWKKFDEGILKPILIYNYNGRRQQIKQSKKKQRKLELGIEIKKQNEKNENELDPNDEQNNKFIEIEQKTKQQYKKSSIQNGSQSQSSSSSDGQYGQLHSKFKKQNIKNIRQQRIKKQLQIQKRQNSKKISAFNIQFNEKKISKKQSFVIQSDIEGVKPKSLHLNSNYQTD